MGYEWEEHLRRKILLGNEGNCRGCHDECNWYPLGFLFVLEGNTGEVPANGYLAGMIGGHVGMG